MDGWMDGALFIYSIQNSFIGMSVKNTILPKLEICGKI